jgi:hypothetical protein
LFSTSFFLVVEITDNHLENIKEKNQKQQLPFEEAVGCTQPLFQLAVAARQPAATQPVPAATIANLPPIVAAAGTYHQVPRRLRSREHGTWACSASGELRLGTRNGNDRERRPQIAWNVDPMLMGTSTWTGP